MANLNKILIGLSGLGFILAVISALAGIRIVASPEALSRACSNLALISIALGIWFEKWGEKRSEG